MTGRDRFYVASNADRIQMPRESANECPLRVISRPKRQS